MESQESNKDIQELNNRSVKRESLDLSIFYLDIVECPLNPCHKLRRHRLGFHLMKCKKSFPDKIECPYDHYYYLDKHDMANHLQICPHKPKAPQAKESRTQVIESWNARSLNLSYNYDVNNFQTLEPSWD